MQTRTVISVVLIMAGALAGLGSARPSPPAAAAQPAAPVALPPITISPNAPFLVPPPQAGHPPFDWFSWETFVALNWPAAIGADGRPIRGQANVNAKIGDPGPRVWETYKADWETFGTGAQTPEPTAWSSWDVNGGMNPCGYSNGSKRMVAMITKMDSVFASINEAKAGPLIDQNQKFVRFEIRLNQSEYESIVTKQWYLQENLASPIQFTSSTQGTYGAVELKAAWREMVPGKDDYSRYYTVESTVVDPGSPPVCRDTTLGLIGFHIAAKTAPFSEWVWATFEHEDNVPDGGFKPGTRYSLNNGTTTPDSSKNGFNYPPNGANAQTKGPAPVALDQPLPTNPTPVQVTRFTRIDSSIASMNTKFHDQLAGTVWVHYNLVADQWPTAPGSFKPIGGTYPQDSGRPFPNDHVANTAAETYFQNAPAAGNLGNSCMQCHFQVAFTDFSWTVNDLAYPRADGAFAANLQARPLTAAGSAAMKRRLNAIKALRDGMGERFAPPPSKTKKAAPKTEKGSVAGK